MNAMERDVLRISLIVVAKNVSLTYGCVMNAMIIVALWNAINVTELVK